MGKARFHSKHPFSAEDDIVAVVVCRTDHGNLHAGLTYGDEDGRIRFVHLGWEDQMSDQWEWSKLWAVPPVPPERLVSVAAQCELVFKKFTKKREFPYALKYLGSSFDKQGNLVLGEGAQGLTCATFILAIFKSCGINLVDEESWPQRTQENMKFLLSLAAFAKPEHLAKLHDEVSSGLKRVHPDDVLAACGQPSVPVPWSEELEQTAIQILEKLLFRTLASLEADSWQ